MDLYARGVTSGLEAERTLFVNSRVKAASIERFSPAAFAEKRAMMRNARHGVESLPVSPTTPTRSVRL